MTTIRADLLYSIGILGQKSVIMNFFVSDSASSGVFIFKDESVLFIIFIIEIECARERDIPVTLNCVRGRRSEI